MSGSDDATASRGEDRQKPLIESRSIDGVIAATRDWTAEDQKITAAWQAVNNGIHQIRADLSAAGADPPEKPGAPVDSHAAAVAAMESARGTLARALKGRSAARVALAEARRAAEGVLEQAADVKVARWFVGGVAVVLLILLLVVLFHG